MDINSVKVELFTKLRELYTKTVGNIESQHWIDQAENLLNDHLFLRCILIPKSMPIELLCDVFSFTKREDLFSCQLVNRH
uniref:F-box domain-containing protein n=1 Tax=Acrobeloides nanus TaxID=290746 RepID=A0A914D741_9BILA